MFVSNDGPGIHVRDFKWNVLCYTERDGRWERQNTSEASCENFWWLVKDDWPHGLCGMFGMWNGVWKVVDGVHFVHLEGDPFFTYLHCS